MAESPARIRTDAHVADNSGPLIPSESIHSISDRSCAILQLNPLRPLISGKRITLAMVTANSRGEQRSRLIAYVWSRTCAGAPLAWRWVQASEHQRCAAAVSRPFPRLMPTPRPPSSWHTCHGGGVAVRRSRAPWASSWFPTSCPSCTRSWWPRRAFRSPRSAPSPWWRRWG